VRASARPARRDGTVAREKGAVPEERSADFRRVLFVDTQAAHDIDDELMAERWRFKRRDRQLDLRLSTTR